MKSYRYIRMLLSFVNFALFLIIFAFLLPSQDVSKVYGQENPRCKNDKNYIKNYKRQVGDLRIVQDLVYQKRNPIVVQQSYAQLRSAVANRELLDIYRSDRARLAFANAYNLEWQDRFPWETDQQGFQVALRNKIGQLLDKAKNYASRVSIDRDIENLQKRIAKHETNLKTLGCDGLPKGTNCWSGKFRGPNMDKDFGGHISLTPLPDGKHWRLEAPAKPGHLKGGLLILRGTVTRNSLKGEWMEESRFIRALTPSGPFVMTWLPGKTCTAFEGTLSGTPYWKQMYRQ